jgi:hypothetical protein
MYQACPLLKAQRALKSFPRHVQYLDKGPKRRPILGRSTSCLDHALPRSENGIKNYPTHSSNLKQNRENTRSELKRSTFNDVETYEEFDNFNIVLFVCDERTSSAVDV